MIGRSPVLGPSSGAAFGSATTLRPRARSIRARLRHPSVLLALQVAAALGTWATVTVLLGTGGSIASLVLLSSLLVRFHNGGQTAIRPGPPQPGRMALTLATPMAVAGLWVAVFGGTTGQLREAAVLVGALGAVDLLGTALRGRLQRPVRVIVVGDEDAIASTVRRWAADRRIAVVGGLLLNGSVDTPPVGSGPGVWTIRGIEEVAEWVTRWRAEMVVVAPGPGVTAESVRRLHWLLEPIDATVSVLGVLDSVAPHRIEAASFGGTTLIHTYSSRPPVHVRTAKWVMDRVGGLVLLLVASPLLAVLCLWIRLESSGPGLFQQVRVGKDGHRFTMYKLRTMRRDAEVVRTELADQDEGNGLLFKVRDDPRITRSGKLLRKTSLDELPQLLNVVLGQMSLVGPRPALPEEVARYDETLQRRLAVRPGMTGLWQVSGRSDLDLEQSTNLDLHYADNYRVSGDLWIGLRTFEAVLRARGAY